jgi:predicted nuclease of predicted toxin-antitoxin system
VKLLLDENLSFRLVAQLEPTYPGSQHVDSVGLHAQSDARVWEFARDTGFTILSKDNDFRQLALVYGAPPKVIWLAVGNAATEAILHLVQDSASKIEAFIRNPEESLLILELSEARI